MLRAAATSAAATIAAISESFLTAFLLRTVPGWPFRPPRLPHACGGHTRTDQEIPANRALLRTVRKCDGFATCSRDRRAIASAYAEHPALWVLCRRAVGAERRGRAARAQGPPR